MKKKMRKKTKKLLIASISTVVVALGGVATFFLLSPKLSSKEPKQLATPTNLEYTMNVTIKEKETEHLLSWDMVNNATGYKIVIQREGTEVAIERETDIHTYEYDISDYVVSDEDYTIKLTALGDEDYLSSEPTEISLKIETATARLSYRICKDGYEVSRGSAGTPARIVIPDTFNGSSVIKISDEAFGFLNLGGGPSDVTTETVRFPKNLKEIGEFAFCGCAVLDNVVLPEYVTTIGAQAFRQCYALKNIVLPNELKTLPMNCFIACNTLEKIILPNQLEYIEQGVFNSCSKLNEISIPNTLKYIGTASFGDCKNLTEIVIPDSVTYLGDSAFAYAQGLELVQFSKNLRLEFMGKNVFIGTKWYNNQPDGYIRFNDMLYRYKGEMPENTEITSFPEGITKLASGAFGEQKNLVSVVLPDWVEIIPESFFWKCSNLKSVYLPSSLKEIGESAFSNCNSLEEIILPHGLKKIGACSFINTNIKNIEIPDSVERIEIWAIYGTAIENIIVPTSVKEIEIDAFINEETIKAVYYEGSKEDWEDITHFGDDFGDRKPPVYYYSETEPPLNDEGTAYEGNYWYYDENGLPKVWGYAEN